MITRLEDRPELVGRPVAQRPGVRRVHLRRVRYFVFFEIVDDGASVDVIALWHERRGNAAPI